MAEKKRSSVEELKEGLEKGTLVIGNDKVVDGLRKGAMVKVFVAMNCPPEMIENLERVSGEVDVEKMTQSNEEIGVLCRKPFAITVVGILKV